MRRREFIAGISAAASLPSLPLAVRAQQPALPVIGLLMSVPFESYDDEFAAFRRGLAETGHVEGRNVVFEYRTAENHFDRLPALADDLVRLHVAAIFAAPNFIPVRAAKAASRVTPIVFFMGADPVLSGVVASLSRPGGNITGVTTLGQELFDKRLALLHELVPAAETVGCLWNPTNAGSSETGRKHPDEVARALGVQLLILDASMPSDIDRAFATLAEQRIGALLLMPDAFFAAQREQIVALAAHAIAVSHFETKSVQIGALTSYGTDRSDAFRLAGQYVGRILNGEKPGDLPVQQPTRLKFAINLKTAKTLGLTIPANLLAIADEVIEWNGGSSLRGLAARRRGRSRRGRSSACRRSGSSAASRLKEPMPRRST
jgi:putative tryptophan/tyrosine transport system substrate-binding protein